MKESPHRQKLEKLLRSSRLVAGGFLGRDTRTVHEIIDADSTTLVRLGVTRERLVTRMQQITEEAAAGLGNWVRIDDRIEAHVQEVRGSLVCPWPHPGRYIKRVTTVRVILSGQSICWSDLNIHMIAEHGFFEGRGSQFRTEPLELVRLIL